MTQLWRLKNFSWQAVGGLAILLACVFSTQVSSAADAFPYVSDDVVFAERNGLVAVEAEHCYQQTDVGERAFYLTTAELTPEVTPDGDPSHVAGASGGAYLEILPDTRRTHADKLIKQENFSPEPGAMTIAHYRVHFETPGRYYVWVRAYSTGSEDNGLHVGIDGNWPESGQRLQWCQEKHTWRWESKQRTAKNHCGEPHKIFLDVEQPGVHTIHFSMREDGFEFDKWLMTTDREFERPSGVGPDVAVHEGEMPAAFAYVQRDKRFPAHWGQPPAIQTRDLVPLPGGYGKGSSTLAHWIQKNLNADKKKENASASGNGNKQRDLSTSPTKPVSDKPLIQPRQNDGDGSIAVSGEQKKWHKVTLTLNGPYAHEQDNKPNPFMDYRFDVEFTHPNGQSYRVPGYFAADGDAGNSSAEAGTQWRVHFAPDAEGEWTYKTFFTQGKHAALDQDADAKPVKPFHGKTGTISIAASDKSAPDLRALGRLNYVGKHYLQFADSGTYFLKVGADAPETFLAYVDFDNTHAGNANKAPLKTWKAHTGDWNSGDPTWKDGKGKGMIGAINYLSGKGCNAFSFLPYNAGGDGDNIWPFIDRDDKLHYDCSKLDQWGIVFDHGTSRGMYLHFKMQETENDDHNKGKAKYVPESLDGGNLGPQRKLYCRELIARFGHNLALNWNLGEENTQTTEQLQDMLNYIAETDPYDHNIVLHTYPNQQDQVYGPLLGNQSKLTGTSLQNSNIKDTHDQTWKWVRASAEAGKPWVVAFDESGSAAHGQCPDIGYQGFDGRDSIGEYIYTPDEVRKQTLWGTLMAGGAGCEYYFGYKFAENDIKCEDWRSRDQSWDYCRIAINFFHDNEIPFHEMRNRDELVGNPERTNSRYCFAKSDAVYLVYLPNGGQSELDLSEADGEFQVSWFNPRTGGDLAEGKVRTVKGGSKVKLGLPPEEEQQDWLVVVRADRK